MYTEPLVDVATTLSGTWIRNEVASSCGLKRMTALPQLFSNVFESDVFVDTMFPCASIPSTTSV